LGNGIWGKESYYRDSKLIMLGTPGIIIMSKPNSFTVYLPPAALSSVAPFCGCCSKSRECCGTISYIPNSIGRNSLIRQKYWPPKIIIPVSAIRVIHHNNVIGKCQLYHTVKNNCIPSKVNTKSSIIADRRTISTKYNTLPRQQPISMKRGGWWGREEGSEDGEKG